MNSVTSHASKMISFETFDQPGTLIDEIPATFPREASSIEIGPRSQIDAVYITPANGERVLVSVGDPYPVGDYKGPFRIERARGSAALNVVSRPTLPNPPTGRLELVFHPRDVLPSPRTRRAPDLYRGMGVIPTVNDGVLANYSTLIQVPFWGRQRASVFLRANAQDLIYFFNACVVERDVNHGGQVVIKSQVEPLSTGVDTLVAGATIGWTFENDHYDYIELKGVSAASGGSADIWYETRDR